ncbi:peptidoglycan-binding protein [Mariniluteicoccus flavus]
MLAPRSAVVISLAAASLTLAGCARPGLQAVPTVPWETPSAAPAPEPAPAATAEVSTPEPTPQAGSIPTPEAAGTPAPQTPQLPRRSAAPDPTSAPTQAPTSTAPRPVAGPVLFARGTSGDQVREVQARLKQLDWFEGEITGRFDASTAAAVEGFQGKRGLVPTGAIDRGTLDALRAMTRTPSAAELADRPVAGPALLGRGATGDRVRDLQARLAQLGWFEGQATGNYGSETARSVTEFQSKRGLPTTGEVDQATLDKLVAMTKTPSRADLGLEPRPAPATTPAGPPAAKPAVPAGIDPRCMTGRVLCISKAQNKLRWMVNGEVKQTLAVRFGTDEMPTREGSFNVGWKSRDHISTIYKTPMPYAMFFSGGQAVHYSADFAARGYNGGSHGCVNVRDRAGVAWLFGQVNEGDKVIVYR